MQEIQVSPSPGDTGDPGPPPRVLQDIQVPPSDAGDPGAPPPLGDAGEVGTPNYDAACLQGALTPVDIFL